MDPVECFDQIVIFRSHTSMDSRGTLPEHQIDSIIDLLKEALENRVTLLSKISIPVGKNITWKAIGFKLDGHNASRVLTRGPTSDSQEGYSFREFWGEKSQLRRIDGDLCECVLWSADNNVIRQIVDYVLEKYSNSLDKPLAHSWNHILPDRLEPLLTSPSVPSTNLPHVASSIRLIRAMDKLRALLRGLNDKLPLNVTGIFPLSAAFRDTSAFAPVLIVPCAGRSKKVMHISSVLNPIFPLYVVITLEKSGKWPDELEYLLHMKRLLVIRIHELLSPMSIPSHVTKESMLDIFLDGLVFRVSIAQPRELYLLQKMAESGVDVKSELTPLCSSSAVDHLDWIRLNQRMPAISGLLASVSRGESHVFPTACRLAKRWLSAQGFPVIQCPFESELDGMRQIDFDTATLQPEQHTRFRGTSDLLHLSHNGSRMTEVAVELLMVYACGLSRPKLGTDDQTLDIRDGFSEMGVTSSPVVAFLRFLKLLSTHDWEHRPLLVDLNDGFSDVQKRREAVTCMDKDRGLLPSMVICTPEDTQGVEWTSVGPSRKGLEDLQYLARQTRQLLRAMLVADAKLKDLKNIFRPSWKNIDLLIKLKRQTTHIRSLESFCPQKKVKNRQNLPVLKSKPTNDEEIASEIPPPGARFWPMGYCYDPLMYIVHLLRVHLGSVCEIYWDRHGGDWIGLKWRPSVVDQQLPEPLVFNPSHLGGLNTHMQDTAHTQMHLKHRCDTVTDLLQHWVPQFVKSVEQVNTQQNAEKTISATRKRTRTS